MFTIRRLLVPTDFSAQSLACIPYAADLAREFGSEFYLLHVCDAYDAFGYGASSQTNVYGIPEHELRKYREAVLDDFAKDRLQGLRVNRSVVFGDVGTCIAQFASENGIDLVFMPTHGRGRFRQYLLGSVTSKVLHDVPCPVWTTAHTELPSAQSFPKAPSIICALDLRDDELPTLRTARDLSQRFGSAVSIVHVITSPELEPGGVIEDAPFQRFLHEMAQQRIEELQRQAESRCEVFIRHGNVATVIRECVLQSNADLVLVGRGSANRILGPLRSHVGSIIQESPCPVLSI